MKSIDKLRKCLRDCTSKAGSEPNQFDTYWITADACDMLIDEIEAEIAERYMLLPVDADGVPIHVGDVMCSAGIREKGHKVIASAIFEDGFVEYGSDNGLIGPLRQEDWVHVKPDPLKELLEELANEVWEASCTCQTTWSDSGLDGIEERYAERIRELMEADE